MARYVRSKTGTSIDSVCPLGRSILTAGRTAVILRNRCTAVISPYAPTLRTLPVPSQLSLAAGDRCKWSKTRRRGSNIPLKPAAGRAARAVEHFVRRRAVRVVTTFFLLLSSICKLSTRRLRCGVRLNTVTNNYFCVNSTGCSAPLGGATVTNNVLTHCGFGPHVMIGNGFTIKEVRNAARKLDGGFPRNRRDAFDHGMCRLKNRFRCGFFTCNAKTNCGSDRQLTPCMPTNVLSLVRASRPAERHPV